MAPMDAPLRTTTNRFVKKGTENPRGGDDEESSQDLVAGLPDTTKCECCSDRNRRALAWGLDEIQRRCNVLDLNIKKVGDCGAELLAKALPSNTNLSLLQLFANRIGDDGATALAKALKTHPRLQTLELGKNCIGKAGAAALADMFDAGWGDNHDPSVQTSSRVVTLDLSENQLGDKGATAFATVLRKKSCGLLQLDLSRNAVGDQAAWDFAEALKVNELLQDLDLQHNDITRKGGKSLGRSLRDNGSLLNLGLAGNKEMGAMGALGILEGMELNTKIKTLDLSGNDLGEEGAKAVAKMLKANKVLQKLDISETNIGEAGQKLIAEAMKDNKTLLGLGMARTTMAKDGEAAIKRAVRKPL